jgi:hydroxymethylbilane synthase
VVREFLTSEQMCPAAGQGALAIEIRADDIDLEVETAFLESRSARRVTDCERALLRSLGGGCQVSIGAFAELSAGGLQLTALVASPDGSRLLREKQDGSNPDELGRRVGEALLRSGAQAILDEVYGRQAAVPQQP